MRALAIGALTVDAIRILAQQGRKQPSQWFNLDGPPHLQGHEIPPPHLDRYASLLPGGAPFPTSRFLNRRALLADFSPPK